MKLYPAIYIKEGKCVKLNNNNLNDTEFLSDAPYIIAKQFENDGADFIYVLDLDGIKKGCFINIDALQKIIQTVNIPVIAEGGINSYNNISELLELGLYRVIIEFEAMSQPEFFKQMIDKYNTEQIAVSLCSYKESFEITSVEDILPALKNSGLRTFYYTEISKDGILLEPDIQSIKTLSEKLGINIIFSGNIQNDDVLKELNNAGIYGTIIGNVLYEKKLNLQKIISEYSYANTNLKSSIPFSEFKLDSNGLIPVVVQDFRTNDVLMVAYMNEEAFTNTVKTGIMTYYSRSRQELWIKGLTSGHLQYVKSIEIDCDNDTLLAKVKQIGAACHTGNRSCFYRNLVSDK